MRLSRFTTPYQRLVIGWIIKFTFYKALIIVNYLRKAKCQLSILGRYQIQPYGKTRSIIASTILRWGTQVNLLTSVADSKSALRSYVDDADARFPPRRNGTPNCIKEYILDVQFRTDLDELITILRPIHEHQRMSESEDATIDKVYTRWFDIKLHLNAQTRYDRFREEIEVFLLEKFSSRLNKQVNSAHRSAPR